MECFKIDIKVFHDILPVLFFRYFEIIDLILNNLVSVHFSFKSVLSILAWEYPFDKHISVDISLVLSIDCVN